MSILKDAPHYHLAAQLGALLSERKMRCAVAESCTGGSLSAIITEVAGSSQWFDRAYITYTNEAKEQMLGVPHQTILHHGAVSDMTARAMAEGVIAQCKADISVAITGIAGPGGGSSEKPVGTVWIAWAGPQATLSQCYFFVGDRAAIRSQAVQRALEGLLSQIKAVRPY